MSNKTIKFLDKLIGKKTTGFVLKSSRLRCNLTQDEVSIITGIDATSISRYENDKLNVGAEVAGKFAAAYGISLTSILFPNGLDAIDELQSIREKSVEIIGKKAV